MRNLEDMGFKGSKYTWWNGRTDDECIFKRLDRILCNDKMGSIFPIIEVKHLVRSGSDHSPLLISMNTNDANITRSFKFLNFWLKEESFMEVVRASWSADFEGDPFIVFHHKLKKLKRLSQWSRETFGDIFQEIATLEDLVRVAELQFEIYPTGGNKEKLHEFLAKLNRYLHREEEFWR